MRQLVPGLLLAAAMLTVVSVVSVCARVLGVRGPSVAARLSWVAAGAGRRLVTSPTIANIHRTPRTPRWSRDLFICNIKHWNLGL